MSDTHRYVYVELPRTGSTAVAKELIDQYGGRRVLHKHSTYRDFLRIAGPEQRAYFAFSNIRNPLDDAVSRFYKMKSDHHGRFGDPVRRKYRVGNRGADSVRRTGLNAKGEKPVPRSVFERLENRKQAYIERTDADFATFFKRFYWLPYDNWSRLSHRHLDHVIRFETLEDDFAAAIQAIGLEQTRPLPVTNRTEARERDYVSYYTDEVIPRARFVFGPYLRRWGYSFPEEWNAGRVPRLSEATYAALAVPRTFYWQALRAGS